MSPDKRLKKLTSEFEKGMALSKCRKCGCMKGALEEMLENLTHDSGADTSALREKLTIWLNQTEDSQYT